ncbi:uncharacterized protein PHALS_10879 [Plasmopara halstedii]|uniref:Uncharacterized protein n=1 Tax=Plasmopara halstedii TaxID=4781 RepID=A0A0P1AI72_PLAHL|nr:uncharacterized protein PHALS_10879 [Plasmopara halstedii]CEG40695.1 hypothetical protein PHALS_10879 [Plasmopara halstedii]|eukprot:XP_024577064.1 hypothetical protein PHALS_10879 [Plasmopara halstedii]
MKFDTHFQFGILPNKSIEWSLKSKIAISVLFYLLVGLINSASSTCETDKLGFCHDIIDGIYTRIVLCCVILSNTRV